MYKIALIGLFFIIGLTSCNKENDNLLNLTGTFSEISPVNERTQIEFLTDNTVLINKSPQTDVGDKFTFVITNNSIKLTSDNSSSVELEFEIISDSKFKIENLYPSIPENPKTYMIFEKVR